MMFLLKGSWNCLIFEAFKISSFTPSAGLKTSSVVGWDGTNNSANIPYFHRVDYLYFLAIAALNQLPPSAVFGMTVSLFPLLFVLSVTAIKDGYEDWRRHRSDRKENNREALVLQSGQFVYTKWNHIQAGEHVKIFADEAIACDMVLTNTSAPSGIAYIQTINLDGESNLMTRYAGKQHLRLLEKND